MNDFKLNPDDAVKNSSVLTRATTPSVLGEPILKGVTGTTLELKNLVAGTNITLTSSNENVQIDASGGGGTTQGSFTFTWVNDPPGPGVPNPLYLNGWYDQTADVTITSTVHWQKIDNLVNLYTNITFENYITSSNMIVDSFVSAPISIDDFTTNIPGVTDTDVIDVVGTGSAADSQMGEIILVQMYKGTGATIDFYGNQIPAACTGTLIISLHINLILNP